MQKSKEPGRIATFYSYKGGTGRSMLVANTGWLLASAGYHVLMVDWDLEAPGLHRYLAPFLTDPQMTDANGLIDLVVAYAAEAVERSSTTAPRSPDWYRDRADVLDYVVSINWKYSSGGTLSLLPAGRQGSAYATKVNSFIWQNFYERLGGHGFFEALKQSMRENFDFILIDSRTGVSDTAGICTVQFPDSLIVCFTLNNQSIEGAAAVARSVMEQKSSDGFKIFPVPTRLDNSESDKLLERWKLAKDRFGGLLPADHKTSYWDDQFVLYVPKFAYEEVLAVFANRPDDPANLNLLAHAKRLTQTAFGVEVAIEVIADDVRANVLDHFAGRPASMSPDEARRKSDEAKKKEEMERALAVQRAQEETRREAQAVLDATMKKKRWQWGVIAGAVGILMIAAFAISDYRQRQQVKALEQAIRDGDEATVQGNWNSALAEYTKAIEGKKQDADLYTKRAVIFTRLAQHENAFRDWDIALKLQPNDSAILLGRAQAQLDTGNNQGAIQDLEVLAKRYPKDLSILNYLARAQERDGQLAEANRSYSLLIEQASDIDRPNFIVRRAHLYQKLGDKQNAVTEFQRIIKEYPASPSAEYAEVQLKELGVLPVLGPRPPVTIQPVVYIQYADPADDSLAQLMRNALQNEGIKTPKIQLAKDPKRGEIRYFQSDDLENAARVKRIVERELARQKKLISLPVRLVDAISQNPVTRLIEVWLPNLKINQDKNVSSNLPPHNIEEELKLRDIQRRLLR